MGKGESGKLERRKEKGERGKEKGERGRGKGKGKGCKLCL